MFPIRKQNHRQSIMTSSRLKLFSCHILLLEKILLFYKDSNRAVLRLPNFQVSVIFKHFTRILGSLTPWILKNHQRFWRWFSFFNGRHPCKKVESIL